MRAPAGADNERRGRQMPAGRVATGKPIPRRRRLRLGFKHDGPAVKTALQSLGQANALRVMAGTAVSDSPDDRGRGSGGHQRYAASVAASGFLQGKFGAAVGALGLAGGFDRQVDLGM